MQSRFPARTALVAALALTFGAPAFAADQLAQSSATTATTPSARSGASAQDGTRSTDPQVNPSQSGFNDWTQRNATGTDARDTTSRDPAAPRTGSGMNRNDAGASGGTASGPAYGGAAATAGGTTRSTAPQDGTRSTDPQVNPGQAGFNDWTQRNAPGTGSNAPERNTRETPREHRGMMMDGGRMGDAMRRHHSGMSRSDALARQDQRNQVEPGAGETRVYLYPDSGNAQAD